MLSTKCFSLHLELNPHPYHVRAFVIWPLHTSALTTPFQTLLQAHSPFYHCLLSRGSLLPQGSLTCCSSLLGLPFPSSHLTNTYLSFKSQFVFLREAFPECSV